VNELARRLERDYKNVHGERLAERGLIERRKDALVSVAWDIVRAEMRLAA
jgi:predicted transcriptional regulator